MTNDDRKWQTAALSWLLPGLGQLCIGQAFWGLFFLSNSLILWISAPYVSGSITMSMLWYITLLWVLPALSAYHAIRFTPVMSGPTITAAIHSSPWGAVFWSLVWPGLGLFYARRWIWGTVYFIVPIAVYIVSPGASITRPLMGVCLPLIVCLHSYLSVKSHTELPVKKSVFYGCILLFVLIFVNIGRPALSHHFLYFLLKVKENNMLPAIKPGEDLFVSRIHYYLTQPKVGDIISFRVDSRDFKIKTNSHPYCLNLVGRIVAAGGDTVQIEDNKLIVNGELCKDYKAYFESMNCDINEYERRVAEIKDGKVYIGGNRYPKYDEDVNGVDIEVLNKELIEIFDASRYAVNEPYVVPKNSFFVLGDNINNSVDSRDFGAISTDNIKGKVTSIR